MANCSLPVVPGRGTQALRPQCHHLPEFPLMNTNKMKSVIGVALPSLFASYIGPLIF